MKKKPKDILSNVLVNRWKTWGALRQGGMVAGEMGIFSVLEPGVLVREAEPTEG